MSAAKHDDLRSYGELRLGQRINKWLLGTVMRHGYRPGRAVWLIVALYLFCLSIFLLGQSREGFVPARPPLNSTVKPVATECSPEYACFRPVGYAIDVVVPLVKLGQAEAWRPNADSAWGSLCLYTSWAATILGWGLSSIAVLGFTGLVRKE